jgi:hypothetical protein
MIVNDIWEWLQESPRAFEPSAQFISFCGNAELRHSEAVRCNWAVGDVWGVVCHLGR